MVARIGSNNDVPRPVPLRTIFLSVSFWTWKYKIIDAAFRKFYLFIDDFISLSYKQFKRFYFI